MTSVAFYFSNFASGGVQRQSMSLGKALLQYGYDVTFVVHKAVGPHLEHVPAGARIHELGSKSTGRSILPMAQYIRQHKPAVLVANMPHSNIVAVAAKILSGFQLKVMAVEHNHFSRQLTDHKKKLSFRILPYIYPLALKFADAVVAVSAGVADDLAKAIKIDRARITVIHNPAVPDDIQALASEPLPVDVTGGRPYVLAIGRLVPQKDFSTLLRAISLTKDVNLLILGDGPLRQQLQSEAMSLGIADRVKLAGFVANPYPLIAHAELLALSSIYEGFGNVIAEALALGTPVVSTDCESGPAEILAGGRYGSLVPVADDKALAKAILATLEAEVPQDLQRRGQDFTIDRIAPLYMAILERMAARR
ncbi:glycosyltransferase [uncultured Agrobacterium sp.]|uniref:glycosyltransferase n=1 Tax=uncultured Agrobacterium sp. TaxID=157277 RepID=UPI0025EFFC2B|nr:glycosyltransferase [uncultured Agrobacterium sp.]